LGLSSYWGVVAKPGGHMLIQKRQRTVQDNPVGGRGRLQPLTAETAAEDAAGCCTTATAAAASCTAVAAPPPSLPPRGPQQQLHRVPWAGNGTCPPPMH
jgi:hypothetical protein